MKNMTDEELIAIARRAAIDSTHRYSYMPTTSEAATQWFPHRWVIDALRAVLAQEAGKCEPVAYVLTRDGEVCYEADDGIVISNTPGDETNLYKWKPVCFEASPPAPVSVDERAEFEEWYCHDIGLDVSEVRSWRKGDDYSIQYERCRLAWTGWQARACLDKVKELNQ